VIVGIDQVLVRARLAKAHGRMPDDVKVHARMLCADSRC
jgi:hypothetical protein